MELIALRVKRFRSLYETGWIPFSDITVLIGENDGGKTTTIDALDVLLGNRSLDVGDFSHSDSAGAESDEIERESELAIEVKLRVTAAEMDQVRNAAPLAKFDGDTLHLVRKGSLTEEGPTVSRLKIVAIAPEDPRLHRDADGLRLQELRQFVDEQVINVAGPRNQKDSFIQAILAAEEHLSWGPCELEVGPAILRSLPILTLYPNDLDPEQVVSTVLRSVFAQEIRSDHYQDRLEQIGREIRSVLDEAISQLKPLVTKYRPDIADVRVTPRLDFERGYQGAGLELIGGSGQPISLAKRGLGIRNQVTLAVYEWNSEILRTRIAEGVRPTILAFDEPDLHLDYGSQRRLFDLIRGFAGPGVQVVVATHSLNFVNRVPIYKLNGYRLDSAAHTVIENVPSGPEAEELFLYQLGAGMGLENSLMFYERCFLVVEGRTEMPLLPRLYELYTGASMWSEGIRQLDGEGNGGARLFAKFLNRSRRNVVFLVDEDAMTAPGSGRVFSKEQLLADGFDVETQVHFVGPRELEEAFSNEVWARVGNAFYPRDGDQSWKGEDFEQMRHDQQRKFKDALLQAFRTDPATLGLKLAHAVEVADEIPEPIRSCFDGARTIANRMAGEGLS